MSQGHEGRSGRISPDRTSRRSYPPQPGRPAVVPPPEYPQARQREHLAPSLPPFRPPSYFPLLMNCSRPLMMLSLLWTSFVQSPQMQDCYVICTVMVQQYMGRLEMPLRTEVLQPFRDKVLKELIKSFEMTYRYLLAAGFTEETVLHRPLSHLEIIHTQEQFVPLTGLHRFNQQTMRRSSLEAMPPPPPLSSPPPPSPPPPPLPPPPTPPSPQPPPLPRPPPSFSPLVLSSSWPPPLVLPSSWPPTPPPLVLPLSWPPSQPPPVAAQPKREPPPPPLSPLLPQSIYSPPTVTPPSLETRASTPEGPLDLSVRRFRDSAIESVSDFLPEDQPMFHHRQHLWTTIQESDDASPSVAQRNPPEDTLTPPSNSPYSSPDRFFVTAPEHFYQQSPGNSYKASCKSADFKPLRSCECSVTSGHMASQSSTPYLQPTTALSLHNHPSRSLHSGGHLVDVSKARKRGRSSECTEVGTLEPPPKRTDELSSRRSATVTENVPYPIFFPLQPTQPITPTNEPSTSRSFMSERGSMSPFFRSPMPTMPPLPPDTPRVPVTPRPPRRRQTPSTRMPPPSLTQRFSPIQPLPRYPAYSPMYQPMHPSLPMPTPDHIPLPDPQNIPLPHQSREMTSCPLCGVGNHSANDCLMTLEHKRFRRQPRKK